MLDRDTLVGLDHVCFHSHATGIVPTDSSGKIFKFSEMPVEMATALCSLPLAYTRVGSLTSYPRISARPAHKETETV